MGESTASRNGIYNNYENVKKLIARICDNRLPGLQLSVDPMCGTLEVSKRGSGFAILATPFWEDERKLPVQIITEAGDDVLACDVHVAWTQDIERDAQLWENAIKPFVSFYLQ